MKSTGNKVKFNSTHMIIYGFFGAILFGALILMLPFCSASGEWTDFLTALFTSATSVCVTGLVVVPTYAYWSIAGKIIILILIQLGGLGIICFTIGFLIFTGKRISLKERRLLQESYNLDSSQGIIKNIRSIFAITFLFETVGAVLYSFRFIPVYGPVRGIWYSVFHSVSAFCNAGVDILGDTSLKIFQNDVLINLTTVILILSGSIGFIVWWDLIKIYKKIKYEKLPLGKVIERMTLHTKLALIITFILIVFGTLFLLISEYNNPETIGNVGFGQKLMAAFFQSVSLRTAGFFTVSPTGFRAATYILLCIFMFIGGSPMGTAGGVKTTTFAMVILEVVSVIRGKNNTEVLRRRIDRESVRTALTVVAITMFILAVAMIALTVTEDAPLKQIVFETFSATGTAGASMNFTSNLSVMGRIIVIVLMFQGRVGPVTMAMALANSKKNEQNIKDLPEKKIMIG